jgi:undecaprenyl-diphosphatase
VQGATEYIPVSSSAHLVLVPWIVGWPDAPFSFEVLVQWGTLIGVFVYFWRDLWSIFSGLVRGALQGRPFADADARLGWLIVLGTIPAVIFGLLLKDAFEAAFSQPMLAAALLLVTGLMLAGAEHFGRMRRDLTQVRWFDALIIGFWQVAALLPGISRSGATISGAVVQGFDRVSAARFSFLLSIPALLGAGVLEIYDLAGQGRLLSELPVLGVGFLAAAISGYLCIRWLLAFVKRHSLYPFAAYCVAFGVLSLIIGVLRV